MKSSRRARCLGIATLMLCAPALARAAGYGLYEQGARATGQAGAFTARADDPSSIYFNPAGLSRIDGKELLLSPNLILYKTEFAGVDPNPGYGVHENTRTEAFVPMAGYYAQGIGRKASAGIGIYNPYGLEVEWAMPLFYSGRFISTHSKITPFFFVPTVAVTLNDRLRVGAGANLVVSHVELARHIAAYDPYLEATVDVGRVALTSESTFGAGYNLGVQWWPPGRCKFGATYRSRVGIEYTGRADFAQAPSGDPLFDPIVAAAFPPDQRVATSIPFPAQGSLGIAYQSCPSWAFEADLNLTWWSTFDRLEVAFEQTPSANFTQIEDWKDVVNVRVGTEYRRGGTAAWSYRAGYYFDQTPQPRASLGPLLPDSDRHGVSLGFGRDGRNVSVNGYALWLIVPDRSTEGENRDGYDGTYSTGTFLSGLSLGFHFH